MKSNNLLIAILAGVLMISFATLAFSGHVLIWDGSWFLFSSLSTGSPAVAHDRIYLVPFYWPHLLAARLGYDVSTCATLFGLGPDLFAASVIGCGLWICRRSPLLICGILAGPLVGCLPGQIQSVYETSMVGQVGAVLMAMIAIASLRLLFVAFLVFAPFLYFAHPASVFVFASLAILSIARARISTERNPYLVFAFLSLLAAALRLAVGLDAYERSEMTTQVTLLHLRLGVLGWPLAFILLAWLGLAAAACIPLAQQKCIRLLRSAYIVAPLLALLSGLVALFWAADPKHWIHADTFRRFALFFAIGPVGVCSLAEICTPNLFRPSPERFGTGLRLTFVITLLAAVGTLQIQAWTYHGLLGRLRRDLLAKSKIISSDKVGWSFMTPLRGWFLPFTSVLVQGKRPISLVVPTTLLPNPEVNISTTGPASAFSGPLSTWPMTPDKTLSPSGRNLYFHFDNLEALAKDRNWISTRTDAEFGLELSEDVEVAWVKRRFTRRYTSIYGGNRTDMAVRFHATSIISSPTVRIILRSGGQESTRSIVLAETLGAWENPPEFLVEFSSLTINADFELTFETDSEPIEIDTHDGRRAVFLLRDLRVESRPLQP